MITWRKRFRIASGVVLLVLASSGVAGAQVSFQVLHAFGGPGDGDGPYATRIQASDGNFYGTTFAGGALGYATVFQMTADGTVSVLHAFNSADGAYPEAALIQATDGNFYGTTNGGGAVFSCGTVFQITPDGTFTLLHSFTCDEDARQPHAALIQGTDGTITVRPPTVVPTATASAAGRSSRSPRTSLSRCSTHSQGAGRSTTLGWASPRVRRKFLRSGREWRRLWEGRCGVSSCSAIRESASGA